MTFSYVNYSKKAQFKIQQMAFVLVMIMLLFVIAAIIFLTIWTSSLREEVRRQQQEEAQRMVQAIAGLPELAFQTSSSSCSSCIDLERAFLLKEAKQYQNLWNIDYLRIDRIFPVPERKGECTRPSFPFCSNLTIISSPNYGQASSGFVTLVYYVPDKGGYFKYEIGKVYVSGK